MFWLGFVQRDIEDLTRFPYEDVSNRKRFPYAIKQMISREINIEKMRQEEPKGISNDKQTENNPNPKAAPLPAKSQSQSQEEPTLPPPPIPNWKQPGYKLDRVRHSH